MHLTLISCQALDTVILLLLLGRRGLHTCHDQVAGGTGVLTAESGGEQLSAHNHTALAGALVEKVVLACRSCRRRGRLLDEGRQGCAAACGDVLSTRGELISWYWVGARRAAGDLAVQARRLLHHVTRALMVVLHPSEDELEQLQIALATAAEPGCGGLDGGAAETDVAEILGRDALTDARDPPVY